VVENWPLPVLWVVGFATHCSRSKPYVSIIPYTPYCDFWISYGFSVPWTTKRSFWKHSFQYYTTEPTVLRLCGFCPGQSGRAITRRHIHPLTPIVVINHLFYTSSIYYHPWHPPHSIYMPVSLVLEISLQFFFVLYLVITPYTSYSIHLFLRSLFSFYSTCTYHRNLFCQSTRIMSCNPSLSLNSLVGNWYCSLTPHIHITILIMTHCIVTRLTMSSCSNSGPHPPDVSRVHLSARVLCGLSYSFT